MLNGKSGIDEGTRGRVAFLSEMLGYVEQKGNGLEELSRDATEGLYDLLCDINDGVQGTALQSGSVPLLTEIVGRADRSRGISLSSEAVIGFHEILRELNDACAGMRG